MKLFTKKCVVEGKDSAFILKVNSGGSRISQRRGAIPKVGRQPISQKIPENCMKMKEFGPRGGGVHVPGAPP